METNSLKRVIMAVAKTEVENFIKDNFKEEGFAGNKWKKRKSRNRSDRRNPDKPRRLLMQSGTLQRSIKVTASDNRITVNADGNIPYAKIHNEGGTINHPGGTPYIAFGKKYTARKRRGRIASMGESQMVFLKKDGSYPEGVKFTQPHPIPIPKRQFIGDSPKLRARLDKAIKQEIDTWIKRRLK